MALIASDGDAILGDNVPALVVSVLDFTEGDTADLVTEGEAVDLATEGEAFDLVTEGEAADLATEGDAID